MYFSVQIRLCPRRSAARFKYIFEMYLSGYAATPACLLSSRRVEQVTRFIKEALMRLNHPYIALALEMKKRFIEPVIATSNIYRQRVDRSILNFTRFGREAALAVDFILDRLNERSADGVRLRTVA
jgi:hypothetical protein